MMMAGNLWVICLGVAEDLGFVGLGGVMTTMVAKNC